MRRFYVPRTPVSGSGNNSLTVPVKALSVQPLAPTISQATIFDWQQTIPQQELTVGVPYTQDVGALCTGEQTIILLDSLPAGLTYDSTSKTVSGTPTTVQLVNSTYQADDGASSQLADWTARSTGAGVLWSHNFDTQSEVDQFRWVSNYGNAPNAATAVSAGFPVASRCAWNNTDGFAGGGCVEITVPSGGNSDGVKWWRPMSALNSGGNGKATNDLAANGTTTLRTWSPSNAFDATFSYQKGYFGNATEQARTGNTYAGNTPIWDGTDFYLQFRTKISASRFNSTQPQGKLLYIDILGGSGEQEVLVRSNQKQSFNQNTGSFDIYTSFGNWLQSYLGSVQGDTSNTTSRQPGGVNAATCTFGPGTQTCWEWPADTWVTVLIHVIPGTNCYQTPGFNPGDKATWGAAPHDAGLQVWVAPQGQTTYTKIWDKTDYVWIYDTSRNPAGFNAVEAAAYINAFSGVSATSTFTQRYTQFVLSKNTIPCPQV